MMYLVHSGTYRASVDCRGSITRARDYGPGDSFGSCELLCTMGGRSCTVSVLEAGIVWGIPRHVVNWKLKIPPPLVVDGILHFCQSVRLFSTINKERLKQLCRGARQRKVSEGEVVCTQGDLASELYVLQSGTVATSQTNSDFSLTMHPPESFGESALFAEDELRVRGASIIAGAGGAVILAWAVSAIEALVGFELQAASHALFNRKMMESVRCSKRLLVETLSKDQIDRLLSSMTEQTFTDKEVLVAEGDVDETFFIIKSGEAVAKRGTGSRSLLATLRRADCFGEAALMPTEGHRRAKRKMSIIASGTSPLVVLTITLSKLLAADELRDWWEHLAHGLLATSSGVTSGVDSVINERVQETGGNLSNLLSKQKDGARDNERTSRVAKDKEGGNEVELVAAAPAAAPEPCSPSQGAKKGRSAAKGNGPSKKAPGG